MAKATISSVMPLGWNSNRWGPRSSTPATSRPDAVGPLAVVLRVDLCLFADQLDQRPHGHRAAVGQAMAQTLLLHEVGEHARVRRQARDGDADVLVDQEELFLVRRELLCVSLKPGVMRQQPLSFGCVKRTRYGWGLPGGGGRGRTLIATRTACVLLAMPTTTEPCFTASAAYST